MKAVLLMITFALLTVFFRGLFRKFTPDETTEEILHNEDYYGNHPH